MATLDRSVSSAYGASAETAFDPAAGVWYLGNDNGSPTIVPYGGANWRGVLGDWTGKAGAA